MPLKETLNNLQSDSIIEMTLKLLAKEFSNSPEEFLNLRIYTLDSILPVLSLGLETLALEIEAQKGKDPSLDPVQWLAQYLFRNNPKYSKQKRSSSYIKKLSLVRTDLKQQILDLEEAKRQAKLAEEQRIQKLKQEAQDLLNRQIDARRQEYKSILTLVFEEWTLGLWRDADGFLFKHELIEAFQNCLNSPEILSDQLLTEKVTKLLGAITTSLGSFKIEKLEEEALNDNAMDGILSQRDPSQISRWNLNDFIKELYRFMIGWSSVDIQTFSLALKQFYHSKTTEISTEFDHIYNCPNLSGISKQSVFSDYQSKLLSICYNFKYGALDQQSLRKLLERSDLQLFMKQQDDSASNFSNIFKFISKAIVAEYGIKAYHQLLDFVNNFTTKELENALLIEEKKKLARKEDRLQALVKAFDALNLSEQPKATSINEFIEKVMKRSDLMPLKTQKSLVDWKKEAEANDFQWNRQQHFDVLLNALAEISDQSFHEILNFSLESTKETPILDSNENSKALERSEIEAQVFKKMEQLPTLNSTIGNYCQNSLQLVTEALEMFHPMHLAVGSISLVESAITKATDDTLTKSNFLRFVAASSKIQYELLGSTALEEGLDETVFKNQTITRILNSAENKKFPNEIILESLPGVSSTTNGYIGIPIISEADKAIGVAGFKLQGQSDHLNDVDVTFIQNALKLMTSTISKIDYRNKLISIVSAAKKHLELQGDGEKEIYISDKFSKEFYKIQTRQELDLPCEGTQVKASVSASSYLMPLAFALDPLTVQEPNYQSIIQVFEHSKPMQMDGATQGHVIKFYPIVDPKNQCIAVLKISVDSNQESTQYILANVQNLISVLTKAIGTISLKETLESNPLEFSLSAERLDEPSRQSFLFPKLLYASAKDALTKLTPQSISELKSYKRPSPSIFRIIKGVLYIFGKRPSQVREWNEAVKFVNQELLKQMSEYDPTAIQKKIRFKRLKRVLKKIPYQEANSRPDSPSQLIYDWLIISTELREAAVEQRRRRADLFDESKSTSTLDSDAEELNEEEEEIELVDNVPIAGSI